MAMKTTYTGHDFQKVGIIKDARQNPLSSAARATLAATLGAGHVGLLTTDTADGLLWTWNGTAFVPAVLASTSGLTPKGNIAYNATEPSSPTLGDLYVFFTAGVNTWAAGSVEVQVSDQVYWDGTVWQYIQGNVIQATETIRGISEIATQAETNTGSDDERFVTPLKLASYQSTRQSAKTYFASGITLVADTPYTITHSLGLQNRDAFVADFKVSNSSADVDFDSIDANNLSITSNIAVTGTITVIGF
jgi:hypothetical protein